MAKDSDLGVAGGVRGFEYPGAVGNGFPEGSKATEDGFGGGAVAGNEGEGIVGVHDIAPSIKKTVPNKIFFKFSVVYFIICPHEVIKLKTILHPMRSPCNPLYETPITY